MPENTETAANAAGLAAPVQGHPAYFLHAAGTEAEAGEAQIVNGQPARAFWANAIKIGGKYRHPKKGFELTASPARAEKWLANFAKMQERGVRVPYCVDHSVKARDAMGHVVEMRRDGDWIRAKFLAVGDDAIRIAARNEVSLGIDPDFAFSDGDFERGEYITHLAATPVPVIPGQHGTIAASREGDATNEPAPDVFTLSAAIAEPTESTVPAAVAVGETTLSRKEISMPLPPDIREKYLSHVLQEGEDASKVADEVLLGRVVGELDAQKSDILTLTNKAESLDEALALSRESVAEAQSAREAAEKARDEASGKLVTLSREHAAPDELSLSMYAENFDGAREQAIKAGVPKPVADAFTEMLRDQNGAPGTIALSLAGSGNDRRPFEFKFWRTLADAFAGNPIVVGTKMPEGAKRVTTATQKVNLSRGESGELDESVISQWDKEDESLKQRELASAAAR